jgi:hypothetical protein
MEEIVGYLRDAKKWETITRQAYEEVALNPQYGYEYFIKDFDAHLNAFFKDIPVILEKKTPSLSFPSLTKFDIPPGNSPSIRENFIKFISRLLTIFPAPLQRFLDMKLRKMKRRLALSVYTLLWLVKNNDFFYIALFWNKHFCHEYHEIFLMREYILSIKKALGFSPLSVVFLAQNDIEVYISPDASADAIIRWDNAYKARNITFICQDSWGVPKDIRGKKQTLQYNKLIKHFMDL